VKVDLDDLNASVHSKDKPDHRNGGIVLAVAEYDTAAPIK
jgi:hypothetical protein